MRTDSWEKAHDWYDAIVGEKGHYYHQEVVLPGAVRLLDLQKDSSLLDVACGQGILARSIPQNIEYTGMDISPSLISAAKKYAYKGKPKFICHDAKKPFSLPPQFTHASILLALQNMEDPKAVFQNISAVLKTKGKLVLVLNHPCFRIPRQSSWGIDMAKKLQFRRIDRYMQQMSIPIQTSPGNKESATTYSFHHPISSYSEWLYQSGFAILKIEEWCSGKTSTGKNAKMENRSRSEFPLFLAIVAQKL